jgi:drug/metabolite transporter (DMT)-like permease
MWKKTKVFSKSSPLLNTLLLVLRCLAVPTFFLLSLGPLTRHNNITVFSRTIAHMKLYRKATCSNLIVSNFTTSAMQLCWFWLATLLRSTSPLFTFLVGHILMGTAARVDSHYPRSSQGTGLECVVRHYLMSLCR